MTEGHCKHYKHYKVVASKVGHLSPFSPSWKNDGGDRTEITRVAEKAGSSCLSFQVNEFDMETASALCGDHRGTPESPGRVVTVIERSFWETLGDPQAHLETSSTSTVWGAAYHIPASHAEEVHDYLDEREIDGYTVHYTPFYPISPVSASTVSTTPVSSTAAGDDDPGSAPRFQPSSLPSSSSSSSNPSPMTCMVYIGLPTNSQFLRDPAQRDPAAVAKVISVSRGLSGKNTEYLYLLEKALEGLGLGSADGHVTDLVRRVKALEKEEAEAAESKAEGEVKRTFDPSQTQTHDEFPKNE
ncbi:hypothetical protein VTN00DRAFT_7082 [Thermoascus crustaceus]|uniref:uncharacterized protein n=1 Tax=Thermoascus crustaceus TaxID=5088 RepID=UPI003743D3D4